MTEEALYSGEKTTLDPQLEKLCRQADATRNWTQRLIKDIDAVLVPNPGKSAIYDLSSYHRLNYMNMTEFRRRRR